MPRPSLRPYLACLLLLCLVRTLLPEAWVLALHCHTHTTEEPAYAPARTAQAEAGKRQALLTPKHVHCHEDTFYNVPFQGASPVVVPLPRLQASYRPLVVPAELASSATALRRSALRGPPVA